MGDEMGGKGRDVELAGSVCVCVCEWMTEG